MPPRTLPPLASEGHRANNFDLLRLCAATCVVIAHGYALSGRPGPLAAHGVDFGFVGVTTFFAISGYLVSSSWRAQPHLPAFAAKRALRIFPALAVSVLAVAYLVGPVVTNLPAGDYLRDSQTTQWVYRNLLFSPVYDLPGVFADNPSTAANGSLWSLAVEIRAYGLVAIAGLLGLLSGRLRVFLVVLGAGFTVLSVPAVWNGLDPGTQTTLRDLIGSGRAGANVMVAFVLGMLLASERVGPRIKPAAGIAAIAAFFACYPVFDANLQVAQAMVIPFAVLFLAFRAPVLPGLTRWGDASYGIYVFSYPIEQLVISGLDGPSPVAVIAISLPIAWALALLSWRVVEEPALRLKNRLPSARRNPVVADSVGGDRGGLGVRR